jgi:hypothetical protein
MLKLMILQAWIYGQADGIAGIGLRLWEVAF